MRPYISCTGNQWWNGWREWGGEFKPSKLGYNQFIVLQLAFSSFPGQHKNSSDTPGFKTVVSYTLFGQALQNWHTIEAYVLESGRALESGRGPETRTGTLSMCVWHCAYGSKPPLLLEMALILLQNYHDQLWCSFVVCFLSLQVCKPHSKMLTEPKFHVLLLC